nr:dynamin-related protein 4C-like [Tanacetum cinerariifolium]
SVDFTTCESICMSRRVDSTGKRTVAVVTKCDISPNDLLEKVMANDVNIGLGYTCVRNRINDETYDEARFQEGQLFETHPLLSKIDSSMYSDVHQPSKEISIDELKIIMQSYFERMNQLREQEQSTQEKEKPPQISDIRQLIREVCGIKVCEEQKQNMEDMMLEFLEVCRQKELYCMHNDVDDLIESALNSKLLLINLKSQRLDKKKQEVKNIVEQPTKAEYVSLSACYAQVLWTRTQLTDYGFHFDKIPIYHFIKKKVEKRIVELFFVGTEYQLADLSTKALPVERFKYLVRRLGMRCLTPAELEALANESA